MCKQGILGNIKASRKNSKIHKLIYEFFCYYKIRIEKNKKIADKIMIDLYLPYHGIYIDIVGLAHYNTIYGRAVLDVVSEIDELKEFLIKKNGFRFIRIKYLKKHLCISTVHQLCKSIIGNLDNYLDFTEMEIK